MAVMAEARQYGQEIDLQARRYYDTVTWLSEVLPGSMRTPFEYQFDGYELYASDGSAMGTVFDDSIERAKGLPRYELRRRLIEKEEYVDMLAMMRGERPNTMVVVSDFPSELMDRTHDEGGYNVARKQTMLRILTRTSKGTLKMYSQSLDGSDRQALEAIYASLGFGVRPGELLGQRRHLQLDAYEQEFLVDRLTGIYDRNLQARYGGSWYAGKLNGSRLNTYGFVCQQQDLLQAYLAATSSFNGGKWDYDLAAAMLRRFLIAQDASGVAMPNGSRLGIAAHALALDEMHYAGEAARGNGLGFSGCGATIMANLSAAEQMGEAGYGNQSDRPGTDKYGSLQFKCPKKGCVNTREPNKLLERCQKCGADVRC